MKTKYDYEFDETLLSDEPFIDPDFKLKQCKPWQEVHDELCRRVGKHYGLNDIREAVWDDTEANSYEPLGRRGVL